MAMAMNAERAPLRARERRKVATLVDMARQRLDDLKYRAVTGGHAREHRRELSALSWALERLGYPPSRYGELDSELRSLRPGG